MDEGFGKKASVWISDGKLIYPNYFVSGLTMGKSKNAITRLVMWRGASENSPHAEIESLFIEAIQSRSPGPISYFSYDRCLWSQLDGRWPIF